MPGRIPLGYIAGTGGIDPRKGNPMLEIAFGKVKIKRVDKKRRKTDLLFKKWRGQGPSNNRFNTHRILSVFENR